jgi:two-component SAPR family response regulator
MLPPKDRLTGAQLHCYIRDGLYWALHTPRQTGKMPEIVSQRLKKVVLLFITLIRLSFAWADNTENKVEEGLYFHSFLVDKDSRTGLDLTPEKPFSFSNGFTLSFDFKMRPEHDTYGYIFRIICNQNTNIDLISNIESPSLMLVSGNTTLTNFPTSEIRENAKGEWIKTELTVDIENNEIKISLNGQQKSINHDVRHLKKFNICFGRNNDINFSTTDVAPFILKDVRILDYKNRPIRHWRLNRHSDRCVFDEFKSEKAVATNAVWEIDYRTEWKKRATITVAGKYPQIAFDKKDKKILIAKDKLIHVYDAEKDLTYEITSGHGTPFSVDINQLLYDETNDQLISYDFIKNRLGKFNFATQKWDNEDDAYSPRRFMHHNKYFDEKNSTVYTFGGYGFHQYYSLLQFFSKTESQWQSIDLSAAIHPRYLAAMGVWSDSLLLCFGGYGNASGKQYESPHNYYDLYAINPYTQSVRKIWELPSVDKHFTNSNSLVVNKANQTFYTLSYPNNIYETQLFLHEYSLQEPKFRRLGNPIPFLFNDVESYCDLFIPADSSALFAVASYMVGDNSMIDIYSISYPPLGMTEILQTENKTANISYTLLYILLFIVMGILTYLIVKRIKKMMYINSVLKAVESDNEQDKKTKEKENKVTYPAIYMLDMFEALDSKGANISHLFTPTISQMFILLYFRTKDGKGITSNELQKSLWPDKDCESARNNRNVYFNKLRPILNIMGNIRLSKIKGFWVLSYDEGTIYCDYETIMENIELIRENAELDIELLQTTMRIAKKGKLLPSYEIEWLDNYKTAYSNTIIEFLMSLIEHPDVKNNLLLLLNISEIILIQDSLDESAIKLKCGILYKLGKKKQALQCYNKYTEEHLKILNIKPELTFDKIVE